VSWLRCSRGRGEGDSASVGIDAVGIESGFFDDGEGLRGEASLSSKTAMSSSLSPASLSVWEWRRRGRGPFLRACSRRREGDVAG